MNSTKKYNHLGFQSLLALQQGKINWDQHRNLIFTRSVAWFRNRLVATRYTVAFTCVSSHFYSVYSIRKLQQTISRGLGCLSVMSVSLCFSWVQLKTKYFFSPLDFFSFLKNQKGKFYYLPSQKGNICFFIFVYEFTTTDNRILQSL